MAKQNGDWTPEIDDVPPSSPRNRDELVQHARIPREPAAANATADAEAGAQTAPSGVPSNPPKGPADTYAVKGASPSKDVRAGPGDAGGAASPQQPTTPMGNERWSSGSGRVWIALAVGVVIVVLIISFF